jgi:UDP-N-acetyl-D-galactosamine dehydrogenase
MSANHPPIVSVVGLGYVGLPVAVAMARHFRTIGFDVNPERIRELRDGVDRTKELSSNELRAAAIEFVDSVEGLRAATFHIVAVPTPVDQAHRPDMSLVLKASEAVGRALKKGDVVVYESTVYPGATEEDCAPVLERLSGLRCGVDFKIGYSPERINPGDKEHSFAKIKKVVAGQDAEALNQIANVYGAAVEAGVHRAPSIKVAEAAKVIENTQRDLNIALMNELALIFDRMGIDTLSVLEAAGTKWNFVGFRPGLVGGHCIGVDPYYLTHKAETLGYQPQVILAGRRINDAMGEFIAQKTIKKIILQGHAPAESRVTVMGLTFKENCPDLRNSRVIDIVRELREYGASVQVCDPEADPAEAKREYGIELVPLAALAPAQAVVFAVAHQGFRALRGASLRALFAERGTAIDVKGIFSPSSIVEAAAPLRLAYWRL